MSDEEFNGILIGVVTRLDDPQGLGRVMVRYPTLEDQASNWARLATPMAGKDRGVRFVPEVDEEVLVAWHGGDARQPFILGGLWNAVDPPPADDGRPKKNNHRTIVSRSGHVIRLDDTAGSERIEIIDGTGDVSVVLDSAGTLTAKSGGSTVELTNDSISISGQTVTVKAGQTLTLEGARVVVKGQQVAIN